MTLQEDFAAAAIRRAEQIRAARAVSTPAPHQPARAQATDWLKGQFEVVEADRGNERQQSTPEPDGTDVFNHIPTF